MAQTLATVRRTPGLALSLARQCLASVTRTPDPGDVWSSRSVAASPPCTPPSQQWPRSPGYLGLGSGGNHCHGCKQTSEAALKLALTRHWSEASSTHRLCHQLALGAIPAAPVIGGGARGKSQDSVYTHGPCLALQSAILLCYKQ